MSDLDAVAGGRYVSLTTFRKDGRGVATAVWFVGDGEELLIATPPETGKLKRIRNNGRVAVAPCDMRGRVAEGAPSVEGTATIADDEQTHRIEQLLVRRYPLASVAFWWDKLRRRKRPTVGIVVNF